ncbi:type 1 periplasmic-binding domain-containing protein [Plantactinospora sonchi]|uniref:ABC transporter substrate-binding protein n=1 Tax=Plantactinospora sonchi TaxID=1544735 RepID=A0ABU7RV06_9ACTN
MRGLADQKQSTSGRERLPSGGSEFLGMLAGLLRRPRRGERKLPLIWLVRAEGAPDLVSLLRRILGRGQRRRIPHAVLDAPAADRAARHEETRAARHDEPRPARQDDGTRPARDDDETGAADSSPLDDNPPPGDRPAAGTDLAVALRTVYRQLSLEAFGGERLRFRHYPLADWLLHQAPGEELDAGDRRRTLVRRLRDRRGRHLADETTGGGPEDAVATVYQFAFWLVRRAIPSIVFRVAISGRVPLLGQHYRWFMRQQYLAPRQSVTFLGFAERLTAGWRDGEQPDQVHKLLVHAFLEDLRQAYRRRFWRPGSWRRTAYPILLVDGVTPGDAGHALVRLVNDVRNETGRNDPLLVLVAATAPPPELPEPYPLVDAEEAYDEWADVLPETRRLRRAGAWLIVLALGDPSNGSEPRGGTHNFTPPRPPWWSRRFLPAAVCLLLLAGAATWVDSRWSVDCHPAAPLGAAVSVEVVGGECVGYSDSARHVFNRDPGQERLRAVQQRIFAQNAAAEQVWERSDRRRPFLTLVYLGTLTGNRTRTDEESYVSEREELEGMATAQYALLQESAGADGAALLRVVVANGGHQMRHAGRAVAMLAELARDDPTVLGVVGLVDSRTSTALALRELNRIGLPAIAPTLSADDMDANSDLYLQISAPNRDQVAMIDEYARQVLRVDEARVYYTTGENSSLTEDLYVSTMLTGLRQRFGDRLGRVEEWRTGQRLTEECGYPGLLLFTGRWSEFDGFLRALKECGADPPRHLVANDSANRYMANPGLRASAPGNLPVTYVSKAGLASCASLRAARERRDDVRGSFLTWIQADDLLEPPRCRDGDDTPVGERVSLAYDAATMMIRAVEGLAARLRHADPRQRWNPRAVNPLGVHTEVLRQNAAQGFPGVAGPIQFATDSGEPVAKRISLLRVTRVPDVATAPVEVFHCGVGATSPDQRCRPV